MSHRLPFAPQRSCSVRIARVGAVLFAAACSVVLRAQGSPPPQSAPVLVPESAGRAEPEKQVSPERDRFVNEFGTAPTAMESLRMHAGKLMPLASCPDAARFLVATSWLPVDVPRVIYKRAEPRAVLSPKQFEALPESERVAYQAIELDDYTYYYTRYGSPLAYLRPVRILCEHFAGIVGPTNSLRGKKILDYGYGTVGHLRLLASIGCDVTGVDVDPVLSAMYSQDEDQGEIPPATLGDNKPPAGTLTLVSGLWPGDAEVAAKVGTGYDIILSKNTLKKGFINPSREADKRTQVNLSVEQPEFVAKLFESLNPGGVLLVYNICPRQADADKPFIPWAQGEFPFARDLMERVGFEVLAWDQDDTQECREVAKRLGWDTGPEPMDLEKDLVVQYTLVRKPGDPAKPSSGTAEQRHPEHRP